MNENKTVLPRNTSRRASRGATACARALSSHGAADALLETRHGSRTHGTNKERIELTKSKRFTDNFPFLVTVGC